MLSREDYTYQTEFDVTEQMMKNSQIRLKFLGIDTLADIYLNGTHVGNTYNMHRTWEFSVRELLKEKGNLLEIRFHSPILYMEEQNRLQGKIPCNTDTIDGFPVSEKIQLYVWLGLGAQASGHGNLP